MQLKAFPRLDAPYDVAVLVSELPETQVAIKTLNTELEITCYSSGKIECESRRLGCDGRASVTQHGG